MVALQTHCLREARALAFRSSTLAYRARNLHSSISLRDEKSSETPHQATAPLNATIANQAAFNAISNAAAAQSGSAPPRKEPSLVRFVTDSGPGNEKGPRVPVIRARGGTLDAGGKLDGRSLGRSSIGSATVATRRPPAGGARTGAPRSTGASRRPGFPRASGGAGGPRQGRPSQSKGKGKARPKRTRQASDDDAIYAPEFTFNDYKNGYEVPDRAAPSDSTIDYIAEKAEREIFGEAYTPQMDENLLTGSGPGNLVSPSGAGELMHRLLSRTASTLEPTNESWPSMKAQQLLHGQTVFFHSEDEARAVQDQIKALRYGDLSRTIDKLKPEDALPKGAKKDISSFPDIKLKTIPEAERAAVHGAWFAGTYVAPGESAGKNASEVHKGVWRQTARNETYLTGDERSFARKLAAFVPARALPARAAPAKASPGKTPSAKGQAAPRQAASA